MKRYERTVLFPGEQWQTLRSVRGKNSEDALRAHGYEDMEKIRPAAVMSRIAKGDIVMALNRPGSSKYFYYVVGNTKLRNLK